MLGTNPIRPPVQGDGLTLDIQHIFPTIQGEGPYAGLPAVFVRLGGCNLACMFCDTEFESFKAMKLAEIVSSIKQKSGNRRLVVITGGEPLRQPIEKLCEALLAEGFKVQIETNGTLYRQLPEGVEIVCSPKNTGKGYFPLRPDLQARVNALKFIVSAQHAGYGDIPDMQGDAPVYVQPMDEHDDIKNAANLKLAMRIVVERGFKLSLQLHKIIGVE